MEYNGVTWTASSLLAPPYFVWIFSFFSLALCPLSSMAAGGKDIARKICVNFFDPVSEMVFP
jgi:hypothetical protein